MNLRLPSLDDIVLGTTVPLLPIPQFRLNSRDQSYHATLWGRTGSGKSKLLQSMFIQHLNKKHGVGIIEPHHDLSFDCLTYLVSRGFFRQRGAYERLIYLDWGNGCYVPFNVLGGTGEPHSIALNALEAMLRVWPELQNAPTFQTLFLSSMVTLIANQLPITFLYQLLADNEFRRNCLSRVDDSLVHQTFASYEKLGRDQVQEAGSATRRAFLLSFSPVARNTFGQPDNWLNFRKIMDEGRSLIINLGNINDSETRKLIGAMLMVQIEQAALSRTDLPPSERTPFNLMVDEWPSFAAQEKTIGTILSQTRKFNLRLYLAAQSLSQVSSERLAGALENCRLTVAFGLGRDSAAIQSRHIGQADPFLVKDPALTETQHTQYMSVLEQFEQWTSELQNLPPRMAYAKLHDQPAVKIKTLGVPEVNVDPGELKEVLREYQRRYQRSRDDADTAIGKVLSPASERRATGINQDSSPPSYTTLFSRRNNSGNTGEKLSN